MEEEQKILRKLHRRTRFTQFLVWIALFFTAAGIAAGYKNWLRIHDKAKAGVAGVAEIRKQIPDFADKKQLEELQAKVNNKLDMNMDHLNAAVKELRHIQDSTQHIAETVYTQVEKLTIQQENSAGILQAPVVQDWSLLEVHFLLQTARQVFKLKQDKEGAITALRLADELLLKRGSTELLPLRKQISQDISLVSQFSLPDIDALSEIINNLQAQLEPVIPKSDVVSPKERKSEVIALHDESQKPKEKESIVDKVKKTLTDAVVIKRNEKPLQDEMDLEVQKSLYQLLSLRLETLRLMLLQGRDKSYHNQINRIRTLLKKYYSEEKYQPLKKQLDVLNSVNLSPVIPDISKSLNLLESISPLLKKGE